MKSTGVFLTCLSLFLLCGNSASAERTLQQYETIDITGANTAGANTDITETPPPTYPLDRETVREMKRRERAERQRRVKIKKLMAVINIEGPEFSMERYTQYQTKRNTGIALTALGGASLVASVFLAAAAFVNNLDWDTDEEYEDPKGDHLGVSALVFLGAGAAGVSAGIPLLVIGQHGVKRQKYLRKKDEILTPRPHSINLGMLSSPKQGVWGVALGCRF